MRKPRVINTFQPRQAKYVIAAAALTATLIGGCQQPPAEPAVHPLVSPAPSNSAEPHLALTDSGEVILSWQQQDKDSDLASLHFARMSGDTWGTPRQVAAGDNWFVNWADFPAVQPMAGERLAAHWLVKRPGGTYAYDVSISLSEDGANWTEPFLAHDDGTPTEHGFVSLFPFRGQVGAAWLDGRETGGDAHDGITGHDGHAGGMTLRYAFFAADGSEAQAGQVDGLVCDCCQTDAAPTAGGMLLAYRDRSETEVRDVMVRRFDGAGWSAPVAVDDVPWTMPGCPVNGPAISANGNHVAVAWFTGAGGRGQVKLAVSHDGGTTFRKPVLIDGANPIGRVDVDWLSATHAVVSWMATTDTGAALRVVGVAPDGSLGTPLDVAAMSPSRASGFPQMLRRDQHLVLAWTDVGESPRVLSARIDTATLLR